MQLTTVTAREDVTESIINSAVDIVDGWYAEGRIDWEDVLRRLEDYQDIDLGADTDSPAIRFIKTTVRRIRAA